MRHIFCPVKEDMNVLIQKLVITVITLFSLIKVGSDYMSSIDEAFIDAPNDYYEVSDIFQLLKLPTVMFAYNILLMTMFFLLAALIILLMNPHAKIEDPEKDDDDEKKEDEKKDDKKKEAPAQPGMGLPLPSIPTPALPIPAIPVPPPLPPLVPPTPAVAPAAAPAPRVASSPSPSPPPPPPLPPAVKKGGQVGGVLETCTTDAPYEAYVDKGGKFLVVTSVTHRIEAICELFYNQMYIKWVSLCGICSLLHLMFFISFVNMSPMIFATNKRVYVKSLYSLYIGSYAVLIFILLWGWC